MKEVLKAVNFGEFAALESLCRALWHETYDGLLGGDQVDYMLEKFQSERAFFRQMRGENYRYFFIVCGGETAGYTALAYEKERLFLSKLYLKKEYRGTGLAKTALEEIFAAARRLGYGAVYLTVNKKNARAIAAYEKYGFERESAVVGEIGGGYVTDDYVYARRV